MIRVLALVALLAVGCTSAPCSFRNPEYAAHVAACDARIGRECDRDEGGHAVATCPALLECKAWASEVCK